MTYTLKMNRFYKDEEILTNEQVLELLNGKDEPQTIEDWFTTWQGYITELSEKERDLINLKETYRQLEQEIIDTVDFKELYGKNNETIRKNHVKNELKDELDARHDLELRIDYLKRRLTFVKELMRMQGVLMQYGGME